MARSECEPPSVRSGVPAPHVAPVTIQLRTKIRYYYQTNPVACVKHIGSNQYFTVSLLGTSAIAYVMVSVFSCFAIVYALSFLITLFI